MSKRSASNEDQPGRVLRHRYRRSPSLDSANAIRPGLFVWLVANQHRTEIEMPHWTPLLVLDDRNVRRGLQRVPRREPRGVCDLDLSLKRSEARTHLETDCARKIEGAGVHP
jgi:hypothetical protein